MKKAMPLLLSLIMIIALLPSAARADIGPKPSVVIDFKGFEGQVYYATLLSSYSTTGPFSVLEEGGQGRYGPHDDVYPIFQKFLSYKDTDGYYFLQYFDVCTQTHQFSWTYYPPSDFKVLLYFSDTDSFMISHASYERYAFDSRFSAEASNDGFITLKESYNYFGESLAFLVRTALTIGIELLIALLFGLKEKRLFRFIVVVNAITQVALNLALNAISYYEGFLLLIIFYILLELLIFIIEGVAYAIGFKKRSEQRIPSWKAWVYAFTANAASFVLGLTLAAMLPSIF